RHIYTENHRSTTPPVGRKLGSAIARDAALAHVDVELPAHWNHSLVLQCVVPVEPGGAGRTRIRWLDLFSGVHVERFWRQPGESVVASDGDRGGRLWWDLWIGGRSDRGAVLRQTSDSEGSDPENAEEFAPFCRLQPVLRAQRRHRQLGTPGRIAYRACGRCRARPPNAEPGRSVEELAQQNSDFDCACVVGGR